MDNNGSVLKEIIIVIIILGLLIAYLGRRTSYSPSRRSSSGTVFKPIDFSFDEP